MNENVLRPSKARFVTAGLCRDVTALMLLALAYRKMQVEFDIPPQGAEKLALIGIVLWGLQGGRIGLGRGQAHDRIEASVGGVIVGLLLQPHVPLLATAIMATSAIMSALLLVQDWRVLAKQRRQILAGSVGLILPSMAMLCLTVGGWAIWAGVVAIAAAAGLLAIKFGAILLDAARS